MASLPTELSHPPSNLCRLEHDDHEKPEHEIIHDIASNADNNTATFHPKHPPNPVLYLHLITFPSAQKFRNTPNDQNFHDHKYPIV